MYNRAIGCVSMTPSETKEVEVVEGVGGEACVCVGGGDLWV